MNDVTYVEASRALAQRMLHEGGRTPDERIAWAFRTATARTPDADEVAVLSRGLAKRIETYKANPGAAKKLLAEGDAPLDKTLDPTELAGYTMTASIILNLDEVVTRE
jgi:hypothetical protein